MIYNCVIIDSHDLFVILIYYYASTVYRDLFVILMYYWAFTVYHVLFVIMIDFL